jgi:hypothetical protein
MERTCNMHGIEDDCIQGFGEKVKKEKRPLGRPTRRWKFNIKVDLRETGLGSYGLD